MRTNITVQASAVVQAAIGTATPAKPTDGVGAVGSGTKWAKEDHKHPLMDAPGSDTHMLYNNGGAVGASSDVALNDANGQLTLAQYATGTSLTDVGNEKHLAGFDSAGRLLALVVSEDQPSGLLRIGRLVVQWGSGTAGSAVTFGTAFGATPTVLACEVVGSASPIVVQVGNISTTGFTPTSYDASVTDSASSGEAVAWVAFGQGA